MAFLVGEKKTVPGQINVIAVIPDLHFAFDEAVLDFVTERRELNLAQLGVSMKLKPTLIACLLVCTGGFTQLPVTVGATQFELPQGWSLPGTIGIDSLFPIPVDPGSLNPNVQIFDYVGDGNAMGAAYFMEFPDTTGITSQSYAQIFLEQLRSQPGFEILGDSSFAGGTGSVSLFDYRYIDTGTVIDTFPTFGGLTKKSATVSDTSFGRIYIAKNGSNGVLGQVMPGDSSESTPMYSDVTNSLRNSSTATRILRRPGFRHSFKFGTTLYDVRGRKFTLGSWVPSLNRTSLQPSPIPR